MVVGDVEGGVRDWCNGVGGKDVIVAIRDTGLESRAAIGVIKVEDVYCAAVALVVDDKEAGAVWVLGMPEDVDAQWMEIGTFREAN